MQGAKPNDLPVEQPRALAASAMNVRRSIILRLLDDLVGSDKHGLRNGQPERLSGFQVDDQLELRGLLDRQITGFSPFDDLVDVNSRTLPCVIEVGPVAHESASIHELPSGIHSR